MSPAIDWVSRTYASSPLRPIAGDLRVDLAELRGRGRDQRLARRVLRRQPPGQHLDLRRRPVEPLGEAAAGVDAGLLEGGAALLDHRQHRLALSLEARRGPGRPIRRRAPSRRRPRRSSGPPPDPSARRRRRCCFRSARPGRRAAARRRRPSRRPRGRARRAPRAWPSSAAACSWALSPAASSLRRRRAPAPRRAAGRSSARRYRPGPWRRHASSACALRSSSAVSRER